MNKSATVTLTKPRSGAYFSSLQRQRGVSLIELETSLCVHLGGVPTSPLRPWPDARTKTERSSGRGPGDVDGPYFWGLPCDTYGKEVLSLIRETDTAAHPSSDENPWMWRGVVSLEEKFLERRVCRWKSSISESSTPRNFCETTCRPTGSYYPSSLRASFTGLVNFSNCGRIIPWFFLVLGQR